MLTRGSQSGIHCLLCSLILGALVVACPSNAAPTALAAVTTALTPGPTKAAPLPFEPVSDVAERAVQSVLNVSTSKTVHVAGGGQWTPSFNDPFFKHLFGDVPQASRGREDLHENSLGSGVVISRDGLVLTNNHVIAGADDIRVTLPPGREFKAKVVGADPRSDLALLRLEGRGVADLVPLPFGDSGRLRLGETVLAIGNPFGLNQTVTKGIVSAVGRANVGIADYEDFIQTDAAINPGNSGGALVNLRGELVGINTAIASNSGGYQGVGFAIPSDMAKTIMDSLLRTGTVVRGWLGVRIQGVDDNLAEAMHLRDDRGALVSEVTRGSPAARAGIERGDVIVRLDGENVASPSTLRNLVAEKAVGAHVALSLVRDGKDRTVTVVIDKQPADLMASANPASESKGVLSGITVAPLDEALRSRFHVSPDVSSGVVVTEVNPGSAADNAGLQAGDVIVELDHEAVKSVSDFEHRYGSSNRSALLLVNRAGSTVYIAASR